jgi:hypothetical protein
MMWLVATDENAKPMSALNGIKLAAVIYVYVCVCMRVCVCVCVLPVSDEYHLTRCNE